MKLRIETISEKNLKEAHKIYNYYIIIYNVCISYILYLKVTEAVRYSTSV